ncbi:hypothetical protein VST7929_03221 [Vibrio stylophorae]|uniref:nicotinamidase n=1 Tax=Vibrio stylophorae TaxID=659351 RepID=A0ABN8E0S4_9VIBR|nr:isochorismatase family protein [Vibrio stylophorae]CAH0535747.1 hypothetical protein VST7929_03221 [Vibrio stylophorae]
MTALNIMPIAIDPNHTASLDIDPQQGFSELCPLELPVQGALEIVPELLANHRHGKIKLVSRDMHPPGAAWEAQSSEQVLTPVGLPEVDVKWPVHCVIGTQGAQLLPGLPAVLDYDFQINKGLDGNAHPYGALYHDQADTRSTGAIEYLRAQQIDTVIIGGLAFDFCVKKSVEQLIAANFRVILNLAATRAVFPENNDALITEFKNIGVVVIENHQALMSHLA